MPSKAMTFHCLCEQCIVDGGYGPDGSPLGKTLPTSHRIPHLKRVQAESAARREAIVELQQPLAPTSLPQNATKSASSLDTSCPRPQTNLPLTSSVPQSSVVKTAKREQNHRTVKTHKVLAAVERRCQECLDKLTSTAFSPANLTNLEQDIGQLQKAFDAVKRDVPSIKQRKIVIGHRLADLQHHFTKFHAAHPILNQPLLYDSGMFFISIMNIFLYSCAVFQTIILLGKSISTTPLLKSPCSLLLSVIS
jgi:hypothetical protein